MKQNIPVEMLLINPSNSAYQCIVIRVHLAIWQHETHCMYETIYRFSPPQTTVSQMSRNSNEEP